MKTGVKCAFLLPNKASKTSSVTQHATMNQNRIIPEIRISRMMDAGFSDLVENARGASRAAERELRDGSRERDLRPPGSPLPSRCSHKLKLIIERQISLGQSASEVNIDTEY